MTEEAGNLSINLHLTVYPFRFESSSSAALSFTFRSLRRVHSFSLSCQRERIDEERETAWVPVRRKKDSRLRVVADRCSINTTVFFTPGLLTPPPRKPSVISPTADKRNGLGFFLLLKRSILALMSAFAFAGSRKRKGLVHSDENVESKQKSYFLKKTQRKESAERTESLCGKRFLFYLF